MSNKSQLQSNNTSLDILTDRVNAAKQIVAELPDAPTAEQFYDHVENNDVHVTAAEKTSWDNKADTNVATTSAKGLMSSADKTKLDGIAANATAITVDSNLSASSSNPVKNSAVTAALNGKLGTGDTAAAAEKWETARTVLVDLGSTSADSLDGTENITPGVSGTLPVNRGGTGADNINAAARNLMERGSWTPTLAFLNGATFTVTYDHQYGTYMKIGDMVVVAWDLQFTTSGTNWLSKDDYISIGSFPYAPAMNRWVGMTQMNIPGFTYSSHSYHTHTRIQVAGCGFRSGPGAGVLVTASNKGTYYLAGTITYQIN